MIVVDSNVIAYWYIPTEGLTQAARRLMESDPNWNAPVLWRSEFKSILMKYVRNEVLSLSQALSLQLDAEDLMKDCEFQVDSVEVLQLAKDSGCSTYDCEFIAAARSLGVKLVTADKKKIRAFPHTAVSLLEN